MISNEYVAASSLIALHGNNIEEYYKQDIVTNIEFESMIPSIKNYFFHNPMVDFLNKLELSDQKYQTNVNVRYENHKVKLLFTMKEIRENINGVFVPQF